MQPLLVTFALQDEYVELPPLDFPTKVVFTGVGKTMAAMAVTKAILTYHPFGVLNIGTAGTSIHRIGDIIVSRHFVDRDLEPLNLEGVISEIHTAGGLIPNLRSIGGPELTDCEDPIVNTGDDFVSGDAVVRGDAVDMEAFAEAVVCAHFSLPFLAVKYITDIVGQNSVQSWAEKLEDAKKGLAAYFLQIRNAAKS